MRLVALGADFSANNLGNSYNANVLIALAGITNNNKKNALYNLETSLRQNNLWDDFDVLRVMGFGTALGDSFNLKNPGLGAGYNQGSFLADDVAAHTVDGYQPMPTTRYMNSNYTLPADLTNFHVHVFNTSSENTVASTGLVGKKDATGTGGASYDFILSRSYGGFTKFAFGSGSVQDAIFATSGYDRSKTGLLSGYKVGTTRKMYDGGVEIATGVGASVPIGGGARTIAEGGYGETDGFFTSNAKIQFIGYGKTAWNNVKEGLLNTIITKFRADMLL